MWFVWTIPKELYIYIYTLLYILVASRQIVAWNLSWRASAGNQQRSDFDAADRFCRRVKRSLCDAVYLVACDAVFLVACDVVHPPTLKPYPPPNLPKTLI